ncbi:amidohydrolase family protein [Planctomycetota bacterium]
MLTLSEALDHFTRGPAIAEGASDSKGTLQLGAVGDLTVWRENLFALAPEDLLTTPLRATVLGGEVVYEA